MINFLRLRQGRQFIRPHSPSFKQNLKKLAVGLTTLGCIGNLPSLLAVEVVVGGFVRIQLLSDSLVRLEAKGPKGFEDRHTFHVVERNWPGVTYSSNLVAGEVVLKTEHYAVHVPAGASSLSGTYVTAANGDRLYQFTGALTNAVWLPGPAENPKVLALADFPRLIPPPGGVVPVPASDPLAATSGWDVGNDAPDVYVFVPNGSYPQLRTDFLKLTGPTELVPLWALGAWDSRYYDYSEATALQQIADYRARQMPLDVLVIDTGWRQNASTGYLPNASLFPDMPRYLAEAHRQHVRTVFNDHPEPVSANALDPAEVIYRYDNLTKLLGAGVDAWWYDRNWGVSLKSPVPNLRHEVWAMKVYQDATLATNASLRPMIMANVDGVDNGIRNRPPNAAAHRYSIQWSGDTESTLAYLGLGVQNAVQAGVQALFPYMSEDLGGHRQDPSPGDYIRWAEYGALSPIFRPHCTLNFQRMPWTFGPEAEWITRRFVNLRYRLLPELYAAARQNYDTGEPILRRLDLDYPQYPEATKDNQYLIGHSLLVAPIAHGGAAAVPATWLTTTGGQAGLTASYFANTNLSGTPALTRVDASIDFDWGNGSPNEAIANDQFSTRWTGNLTIPAAVGDVILAASSDDGVRIWVDDQLCLSNWGPNDSSITESTVTVKAGVTHQLRVEYLELAYKALVSLKWRTASAEQSVWIPPGNWINAWSGAVVKGPTTVLEDTPLGRIPLFIRSGSLFALAPQMQYIGQQPWSPVTLDTYPSTTETDQTVLYEDDTVSNAYKQGEGRKTTIKTWANDATKTVSVAIGAAVGTYSNALTQRSWVARLRRPPGWPTDLTPVSVTLNGNALGPIVRRVANTTAMPLGADNGAPDADVFEVTVPATSVLTSNLLVASFASATSPWRSSDLGAVGANGNIVEGASTFSNALCLVRGGGAGLGGTNDGFHFLHQPNVGNVQMTVKLLGQSATDSRAEAGLMISESLDPGARSVVLTVTPTGKLTFKNRATAGSASLVTTTTSISTPCWLRLVRTGNAFSCYYSLSGTVWTLGNSVTIPGFNASAYLGLAVTANITNVSQLATNRFGNPIVGVCAEMSGGVYGVDDPNCNVARFSDLMLNRSASISTVPDQTTAPATPTPTIPFTVGTTGGNPLTVSASSSNTNLLPVANIVIAGTGTARTLTLTPKRGSSGTSTVTLTVSDGTSSASTQFTLTVSPLTGLLLKDDFSGYALGNLPGQAYRGTGFAANGSWSGWDKTYLTQVGDAGTISLPGLATNGGKVTVKGDGSNVGGAPDLSANGPFAAVGLLDATSGTIGGGDRSGTLYLSFRMQATAANHGSEYGGLHLSRGNDKTGVLIGNSWAAMAFSLYYAPTDASFDLHNQNGNGEVQMVDNQTHLLVVRINYASGPDTLTAWLDPNVNADESNQNSATTYLGTISGDFSFDRLLLRGGNAHPFAFSEIRLGTDWHAVLPTAKTPDTAAISVQETMLLSDRRFNFIIGGPIAQSYTVWATTNLAAPAQMWASIGGGTFGFEPANFADAEALYHPSRFYRVSCP